MLDEILTILDRARWLIELAPDELKYHSGNFQLLMRYLDEGLMSINMITMQLTDVGTELLAAGALHDKEKERLEQMIKAMSNIKNDLGIINHDANDLGRGLGLFKGIIDPKAIAATMIPKRKVAIPPMSKKSKSATAKLPSTKDDLAGKNIYITGKIPGYTKEQLEWLVTDATARQHP